MTSDVKEVKLCLLGVSPVCIWLDSSHWLQSSLLYWSIYYWGLSLVLVSIHYQHCEDIFSFPNLFPVLLLLIHCTTSLVLRHFFVLPYLHLLLHLFNSLHFKFNLYYLSFALWIVRSENSSVPLLSFTLTCFSRVFCVLVNQDAFLWEQ